MLISSSLFTIGVFCEFGQMVQTTFEMFDDELKRCQWYLFPLEMQRTYGIVMANSQRPTNIRGFGNMIRTREALKKVRIPFELFFLQNKNT